MCDVFKQDCKNADEKCVAWAEGGGGRARPLQGCLAQAKDAQFGLAKVLDQMGDHAGAAAAFKHYIEIEHDDDKRRYVENAKRELERLTGASAAAK
jgi:hypothetical protein